MVSTSLTMRLKMSYREQNPEAWNEDIKRYGYICPECGNTTRFIQYWHVVKEVICDYSTGIIYHVDTVHTEDLHPQIAEIECSECGSQAVIAKKGVVAQTYNHDDEHVEQAIDVVMK